MKDIVTISKEYRKINSASTLKLLEKNSSEVYLKFINFYDCQLTKDLGNFQL